MTHPDIYKRQIFLVYISCLRRNQHSRHVRRNVRLTRCDATRAGEAVRHIIINGYYYPDILHQTNNNTVAHFLRSISVRLRITRNVRAHVDMKRGNFGTVI